MRLYFFNCLNLHLNFSINSFLFLRAPDVLCKKFTSFISMHIIFGEQLLRTRLDHIFNINREVRARHESPLKAHPGGGVRALNKNYV